MLVTSSGVIVKKTTETEPVQEVYEFITLKMNTFNKLMNHIKFSPIIISARTSFPGYFHVAFVASPIP